MIHDAYDINLLQLGDRQSFNLFMRAHHRDVFRLAMRFVPNREDAQDITQEVFLEVYKSLSSFRKESSLSTWLYRITVNRSLNFVKKHRKYFETRSLDVFYAGDESENRLEVPADPSYSASAKIETAERRKQIYRAIDSLTENQKTAFVLHKLEGMPYAAVAEVMSVSLSSVESLIHRAKLGLQNKLRILYEENETPSQVFEFHDVQH